MCETITMPGGEVIESINQDDTCLCNNSQTEVLSWIVGHLPEIEICDKLEIKHTPVGWDVSICGVHPISKKPESRTYGTA